MFNYFIPGVAKEIVAPGDKLDHAYLASIGLAHVLADLLEVPADAMVVYANVGPAKTGGTFIVPTRKYSGVPQVRFDAGVQRWKAANGGAYWLGWMANERAAVKDLERKELIAGDEVFDVGGNKWTVPIARSPLGSTPYGTLPQSFTFDDAGQPIAQLLPKFAWLWDLSGEIHDWYRNYAPPDPEAKPEERQQRIKQREPFTRLVQYAARLLSVNYRVSFVELAALHDAGVAVLTNDTVNDICRASFGWDVEEQAKKKPPADPSPPAESSSSSTTGDAIPSAAPGTEPVAEPSSPVGSSTN